MSSESQTSAASDPQTAATQEQTSAPATVPPSPSEAVPPVETAAPAETPAVEPQLETVPGEPQPEFQIGQDFTSASKTVYEQAIPMDPEVAPIEQYSAANPFAHAAPLPKAGYDPFAPAAEMPAEVSAEEAGRPSETAEVPPAPVLDEVPLAPVVSRSARSKQYARQAAKAQLHNMKKLLAPVCVCMSVLMFLIGMLAVLHLLGLHRLWGRDMSTTWILMSCWLVGAILTYGAIVFFRDVKAYELAQAEEDQARQKPAADGVVTPAVAAPPTTGETSVSPVQTAEVAGVSAEAPAAASPPVIPLAEPPAAPQPVVEQPVTEVASSAEPPPETENGERMTAEGAPPPNPPTA